MLIKRLALCAALSFVPRLAVADAGKGELDWGRRVLVGHGQGAPDRIQGDQKFQIETENAVAGVRGTSSWNP